MTIKFFMPEVLLTTQAACRGQFESLICPRRYCALTGPQLEMVLSQCLQGFVGIQWLSCREGSDREGEKESSQSEAAVWLLCTLTNKLLYSLTLKDILYQECTETDERFCSWCELSFICLMDQPFQPDNLIIEEHNTYISRRTTRTQWQILIAGKWKHYWVAKQ